MPIEVKVVSEQEYATWLVQAKKDFAIDEARPATSVAAAESAGAKN
jgi:heme/copper-type cytochrome/quinol oxidase subunit 2